MLDGKPRAAARRFRLGREREGDNRVERRAVADITLVAAPPGDDEPLLLHHLQHLAADKPVPLACRRRLESETIADDWLEARRRHHPARHQAPRRDRFPDDAGTVREYLVDINRLGAGQSLNLAGGVVHRFFPFGFFPLVFSWVGAACGGSISASSEPNSSSRARQKAP